MEGETTGRELHFMICHSTKCHRLRTSSCCYSEGEQTGLVFEGLRYMRGLLETG